MDDDPTPTQRQLGEALYVTQQRMSRRLRAMRKIKKCGKWVPKNLNERQSFFISFVKTPCCVSGPVSMAGTVYYELFAS